MNALELTRRIQSIPRETFEQAVRLVRQGNGNITLQCDVTRKQCNAVHEWVRLNPEPQRETESSNKRSEAYHAGYEARKQGQSRNANPHGFHTASSVEWFQGYDTAC